MKECVKTRGDDESTAPIRFNGTPDDGIVLDGSRWDGNDFIACHGTFVVTRCVVSALLKIHAYAFRAIPLRTYVGSCTKQQRTELDKLKNA